MKWTEASSGSAPVRAHCRWWLALGLAIGLAGCGAPSPESEAQAPDLPAHVLATFEGGDITFEELDAAILALAPSQRRELSLGSTDAFRNFVRELALDELLREEARLQGIDQAPEIQNQARALERNLLVKRYLEANLPDLPPPGEAEIQTEFERRRAEFQRPERRLVFHLFRRLQPGVAKEALKEEVQQLRQQIVGGQGFNVVAARHSESESRHRDGELGWFQRGELAPELETVIFSLQESVPSQPLVTRDGVHLFMVDVIVDAKDNTLEEARDQLVPPLRQRQRDAALAQLTEDLEAQAEIFTPTADELQAILQRNDPQEVVLRVNEYTLDVATLMAMLANDSSQRVPSSNHVVRLLDQVRRGELIYQQQLDAGIGLSEEEQKTVNEQLSSLLTYQGRQQKLRLRMEKDAAALRAFFDENRMRFTSPLRLQLRRLSVPLSKHPSDQMALLERRRNDLNQGLTTLDELAAVIGGDVHDLGWQGLNQLQLIAPELAALISEVQKDQYSPPYSRPDSLNILHVVDRQEPQPLAFEQVREAVRQAYLERHGQRLYDEVRTEILSAAGFSLHEKRLDELLASGMGPERKSR